MDWLVVWKERKQIITERWGKGYGLTASGGRAKGAGSHLQAEACEKSAAEAEFGEWELCCDSHCSTELAVGPHSSSLFLVLRQEPGEVLPCRAISVAGMEMVFLSACPSGQAEGVPVAVRALLSPRLGWGFSPGLGQSWVLCFSSGTPRGRAVSWGWDSMQSPGMGSLCRALGWVLWVQREQGSRAAEEPMSCMLGSYL